jgi:hypothetical protein
MTGVEQPIAMSTNVEGESFAPSYFVLSNIYMGDRRASNMLNFTAPNLENLS